jgi:hypothetical protein
VDGDGIGNAECGSQDLPAAWKELTAAAAGQETEVSDAHEAPWQHVQQETTQELIDRQSQYALLVFVRGIPPAECDLIVLEADETAV